MRGLGSMTTEAEQSVICQPEERGSQGKVQAQSQSLRTWGAGSESPSVREQETREVSWLKQQGREKAGPTFLGLFSVQAVRGKKVLASTGNN